jgi:hypothetical protein
MIDVKGRKVCKDNWVRSLYILCRNSVLIITISSILGFPSLSVSFL